MHDVLSGADGVDMTGLATRFYTARGWPFVIGDDVASIGILPPGIKIKMRWGERKKAAKTVWIPSGVAAAMLDLIPQHETPVRADLDLTTHASV